MHRVTVLLLALLSASGCRKGATPAQEDRPDGQAARVESTPREESGTDEVESDPPLTLSADLLDRFIAFEKELLDAEAALPRTRGDQAAIVAVERIAEIEEALRAKHRLSERQVDELERMMADVIDHRAFAESLSLEALIAQGEQMKEKLPPENRAEFEAELAEMKQEHASAQALATERERHGDANVQLLLTREEELTKLWNARLARWGVTSAPGPVTPAGDAGTGPAAPGSGSDAGTK